MDASSRAQPPPGQFAIDPLLENPGAESQQVVSLLRKLPRVFNRLAEERGLKDANTAEQHMMATRFDIQPGSSPPEMHHHHHHHMPPPPGSHDDMAYVDDDPDGDGGLDITQSPGGTVIPGGRKRRADGSSDAWSRQRKDNHKEVERRRRGNINEGINELARIVPNGSGEKAKGAILTRAVNYIHHLKENEARNIEKWTLEKILMDQAMGDLQNQLEDVKRLWDEERQAREKLEAELERLRNGTDNNAESETTRSGKRARVD